MALVLEVIAVFFGLAYVLFAARKSNWCWPMGIIGSSISIYLFSVYSLLYAEAILSIYYVITGIVGWIQWNKPKKELPVIVQPLKIHLLFIGLATVSSIGFYFIVTNVFTDAARPLLDSFTTVFSFFATWITIRRWLENWIYWIVIDAVSAYMYWSRDLNVYAGLMLFYTVLAIYAYLKWKKLYDENSNSNLKLDESSNLLDQN